MNYEIRDLGLSKEGKRRIFWSGESMPVLRKIRERFKKEKPLQGIRIACSLHVTEETANLMLTLKEGGAEVSLCGSNPLSTQDEVAASLVRDLGIKVFAIRGEDTPTYWRHIEESLKIEPHLTVDDGADLTFLVHKKYREKLKKIVGGCEETTTGVQRLRRMEKKGKLGYPVIAVNDAKTKYLFDNRYGTGQSTLDGILRSTGELLAGKVFCVIGFGWCGRGIALRARGMGAKVIVCEIDPLKALEATMEGFQVLPLLEASPKGDIFVTATGNKSVIRKEHIERMKDGAILANAGHFNVEIDIPSLTSLSKKRERIKDLVDVYTLPNGKRIKLLGEGRLVNLACAEGHPPEVMDMSFSNQALSIEFLVKEGGKLKKRVYPVPEEIDREVAKLKCEAMGIRIDSLTPEQKRYLSSGEEGT